MSKWRFCWNVTPKSLAYIICSTLSSDGR